MSYADLPLELWEQILSVAPAPDAARFLATGTVVRNELLPTLDERLQAARIEAEEQRRLAALRQQAQAWLETETQQRLATGSPFEQGEEGFNKVHRASPLLSSMLGSSFPQQNGAALVNYKILGVWFTVYARLNGLIQGPKVRIDEFLSSLSGQPVGTLVPYASWVNIMKGHLLPLLAPITPEQIRRLEFIYTYLSIQAEILMDTFGGKRQRPGRPPRHPQFQVLDPQQEVFKAVVRPMSPRGFQQ